MVRIIITSLFQPNSPN